MSPACAIAGCYLFAGAVLPFAAQAHPGHAEGFGHVVAHALAAVDEWFAVLLLAGVYFGWRVCRAAWRAMARGTALRRSAP